MLTGPDVSEFQGDIDWIRVADTHNLGIARIADGDHRDPWFSELRVEAIRQAGLLFAPYYFARVASAQNNQRDGATEAAMAIGFAKSRGWQWPGDLPLIYDFETNNAQPNEKAARHLIQFIEAYRKSEGHHPGIYTMPGFWGLILPYLNKSQRELVAKCFLHQAEWEVSAPRQLDPWDGATLWQWTETGRCPGITGKVDLSRSLVSEEAVLALAKRERRPDRPEDDQARGAVEATEGQEFADLPQWLPEQYADLWRKPWDDAAARSSKFRELCWANGFASPHFETKETACHDPANTPVPASLRANAQRQAFNLEKLRHELGDQPLPVLSWYRTPAWNTAVKGASQSRHLQADATDFTLQTVQSFGTAKFDQTAERVYANGGFGTYPAGSRHVDSRGSKARWSDF